MRWNRSSSSALRRRGLLFPVAVVALAATATACAQAGPEPQDNPYQWQSRLNSVAVFKNGLGFFTREGEVRLWDGWALADHLPPATFGTLAIYSHNEKEVVDVVGVGPGNVVEFDDVDAPSDEASKTRYLDAHLNLRVQLTYHQHGRQRTAAGRLVSPGPGYAILETDDHTFAVPVEGIERLQVLDLSLRAHVSGEDDHQPSQTTLGMAYLREGITWIPEYTLRILDDRTAELTLRGTLINEAEDIIHGDVHFVVGVPHFIHTDYLTPAAVGQMIRTIGSHLAPTQVQQQIMNRAAIAASSGAPDFADIVERPVDMGGNLRDAVGNLPSMQEDAAADYTVYTKHDLTVRRGEKAIVTLFRKTIRYGHIYRWSPPGEIRHFLALHNDTDTAWTTGPCIAVGRAQPLGEDLLRYTPRKSRADYAVTTAINIASHTEETERDRRLKAHSPRRHEFLDLVTIAGRLTLHNYEERPVEIVIDHDVPGRPIEASDEGHITLDPDRLRLSERRGSIRWRLTIAPGERIELKYAYERYVPSG
ncbi:MAG: hypothetical protein SYC29_10650 [Planctomycetota bacterium]|nr:hypothetical protein [Planctomycetota bacterium]